MTSFSSEPFSSEPHFPISSETITGVAASWTSAEGASISFGPRSPTVTVNPLFEVALGPSVARLTTSGSPSPFLVATGSSADEAISSVASTAESSLASARSQRLFLSARAPTSAPPRGGRAWSSASSAALDRHPSSHSRNFSSTSSAAVDDGLEQTESLRSAVRLLESFSSRQQVLGLRMSNF